MTSSADSGAPEPTEPPKVICPCGEGFSDWDAFYRHLAHGEDASPNDGSVG